MAKKSKDIQITRLDIQQAVFTIKGKALLADRMTEKAIEDLGKKQTGQFIPQKGPRDPQAEYEAAKYIIVENGVKIDAFPASAPIAAMVSIAKQGGFFKSDIKGSVHATAGLVPLKFKSIGMHSSMGKNSGIGGNRCPRFRAEYLDWQLDIPLEYDARIISLEQIGGLLKIAGFKIGIGNWTPQSGKGGGYHGTFQVC